MIYVKANNDLIRIDELIRAEYTPAPHNNSTLTLIYRVENSDKYTTSVLSNISKNCLELLAEAITNDKKFVDLSKNA